MVECHDVTKQRQAEYMLEYDLIKDDFQCTERGEFEVKGLGPTILYYLERELPRMR